MPTRQAAPSENLCRISFFFACGDLNQRVTRWGIRRLEDLAWVLPDITVREIVVSYCHSRQLNDLAGRLAHLSSSGSAPAALPLHLEAEGVPPVCGYGLVTPEQIAAWLAHRIGEVERLTDELPTIAVLVCEDQAVKPIAEALDRALADRNIRAVACPDGQARGQDNDVRVFDVQHIKGSEFEAVFFVGVDLLSTREPDLFEKYLYVGATRAATYLGLTTAASTLPEPVTSLSHLFVDDWRRERLAGVR